MSERETGSNPATAKESAVPGSGLLLLQHQGVCPLTLLEYTRKMGISWLAPFPAIGSGKHPGSSPPPHPRNNAPAAISGAARGHLPATSPRPPASRMSLVTSAGTCSRYGTFAAAPFRCRAAQPPPPAQRPPAEGRDWLGRKTMEEGVRAPPASWVGRSDLSRLKLNQRRIRSAVDPTNPRLSRS
jgi:hypothetical protein